MLGRLWQGPQLPRTSGEMWALLEITFLSVSTGPSCWASSELAKKSKVHSLVRLILDKNKIVFPFPAASGKTSRLGVPRGPEE